MPAPDDDLTRSQKEGNLTHDAALEKHRPNDSTRPSVSTVPSLSVGSSDRFGMQLDS
jgi:hypothetical protein